MKKKSEWIGKGKHYEQGTKTIVEWKDIGVYCDFLLHGMMEEQIRKQQRQ